MQYGTDWLDHLIDGEARLVIQPRDDEESIEGYLVSYSAYAVVFEVDAELWVPMAWHEIEYIRRDRQTDKQFGGHVVD